MLPLTSPQISELSHKQVPEVNQVNTDMKNHGEESKPSVALKSLDCFYRWSDYRHFFTLPKWTFQYSVTEATAGSLPM